MDLSKTPPDAVQAGYTSSEIEHRYGERVHILRDPLTASLLADAVRVSGATAVDVSSGVERGPGDKDPDKIREFLAVARLL